jgi:hypothetical protein
MPETSTLTFNSRNSVFVKATDAVTAVALHQEDVSPRISTGTSICSARALPWLAPARRNRLRLGG